MRVTAVGRFVCLLAMFPAFLEFQPYSAAQTTATPAATLPSERPDKLEPSTDSFDYIKRDVMIPMRDGVKLHTVIVIPKGGGRRPMLLDRTPYDAGKMLSRAAS